MSTPAIKRKRTALTINQNQEIIEKYDRGLKSKELASFYNVNASTISTIVSSKQKEKISEQDGSNAKRIRSSNYKEVEEHLNNCVNTYSFRKFLYHLENKYDHETSREAGEYMKLMKKQIKCKLAIEFINRCIENEVLPTFSQLKVANVTLNKSQFLQSIRSQVTREELKNKRKLMTKLEKDHKKRLNGLLFDLTPEDDMTLKTLCTYTTDRISTKILHKQNRKLEALGVNTFTLNQCSDRINMARNQIDQIELYDNRQTIYNLSSRVLSEPEIKLLNKGLKFGI